MQPITKANSRYITRVEFEEKMKITNQRFEDITDIMLREFDKVYVKFNVLEERMDRRFGEMDLRFNRLDSNINILISNLGMIQRHLGIPENQTAI